MAILLVEIVIVAAFSLMFVAAAMETAGGIYALISAMLALWELGRLVVASAGASITTAVITTLGYNGSTFTAYTIDASPFIVALALLAVFSSLVLYQATFAKTPEGRS